MNGNLDMPDSEEVDAANGNSLRIAGCNAATQTPEMHRHAITTQTSVLPSSRKSSFGDFNGADAATQQAPSVVVLRVGKGFTEDFEKEVKALAIPDVVVEYIKDSCALVEHSEIQDGEELGTLNPGYESQEGLSKSVSSANLRFLDQDGPSSLNSQELRKCYSMPRNVTKKKGLPDDYLPMHSQHTTPKLQRLNLLGTNQLLGASSSSLSVYPPNGHSYVAPPSPNFGYRPLESETSAVYTIIKTCLNTNTVKEIHLLNPMSESKESTPGIARKFEYATETPDEIIRKQRWLQCCADTSSAFFFVCGLFITIFTPIIIIPMLLMPLSWFILLALCFFGCGALGVIILAFSGLLGNLVWYYDGNSKKLRLRLHCGRGPRLRFWGNGFYAWSDEKFAAEKEKEFIV